MPSHEILIEVTRFGSLLRVVAVDAASGAEISFQAPASSSPQHIQRLAANKIRYVLSKKSTRPDT